MSSPPERPGTDGEGAAARLVAADRALTFLAVAATFVLLAAHLRLSGCKLRPVTVERSEAFLETYRVDPNTAHAAELALLPGVGEVLAARIVEERESHGPFRSPADLRRVRGIGAKTLEKLRGHVVIGP